MTRSSSASLLVALLAAVLVSSCSDDDRRRPDVVLVIADTLRADRLRAQGGPDGLTPYMDRLAEGGVRFAQARSHAPWTLPSTASLLTSLHPLEHGAGGNVETFTRLRDGVPTLAQSFRDAGYDTHAVVNVTFLDPETFGVTRDFDSVDNVSFQSNVEVRDARATTAAALAWLDANGEAGPWCLWLHMFDVHDYSLVPPAAFARERGIEYPGPGTRLSPSDRVQWRERMYDPELAFMDAQLGRVVAWLRESGQLERTVVVVTADHGQGLSDGLRRHGWMKHRLLYDWSVRVPLIVRVPGIGGGAVVDSQVRTIDIAPTVVDALRVGVRQPMEGDSLLRLMRGEADDAPRVAYADALNDYDAHAPPPERLPPGQYDNLYMACDGRWKLIWHERNPDASQLYDLLKDPDELENLYRTDHPRVAPLMQYLTDRRVWDVEPPGSGSVAPDVGRLR
ncbi:MAG: sulfatase, partial [Planctomycetota bacterium]